MRVNSGAAFLTVWPPASERRYYKACSYYRLRFGALALILLICSLTRSGYTQQTAPVSRDNKSLPDAPGSAIFSGTTSAQSSSISGTVLDTNGASVSGATVTLTATDGKVDRVLLSAENGEFKFIELPAETFTLTIKSGGMATFVSSDIVLRAGENRELPAMVLAVAGTTTQVEVNVTQTELAQEQIKAAEQQRVFGVLPNFYSSYIWDAASLNGKQKFNLALHSITDPVTFLSTGIVAGAEQATDTFHGYGQGAEGYAKRYGAAYADNAIGRVIGSAILPSLFHQDPRYFYMGSGSVRSRVFYAISRAVITRGDNGRTEPNYSRILGSFAAGGIANAYHPAADRGVGLTLGNGLIDIAGSAADNLLREFLLRRLTHKVPAYENGKP